MAFAIENYEDNSGLDDPRFVKWFAHYGTVVDGVATSRELPIYPCTEADYSKFYPVDQSGKTRLRLSKESVNRQLFCIDWENEDIDLSGVKDSNDVGYIDIAAVPCNMQLMDKSLGGLADRIGPECVWDLEAQRDYIKPPTIILYYNQESINVEEYDDESISRFSTFSTIQFDHLTPSAVPVNVNRNKLSDSTSVLKTDDETETSYNSLVVAQPLPSAWTNYPTREDPTGQFKFTSIYIQVTQDMQVTERETYGILEWLGDVGGLVDAL